ncbi:hypothetical protein D3C81_1213780 [compost metagenome]
MASSYRSQNVETCFMLAHLNCQEIAMRAVLIIALGLLALPVSARIYKHTDAEGNTTYSDQPAAGAASAPIELPPLNSFTPPSPATSPLPTGKPAQHQPQAIYTALQAANLVDQQAIRANDGNLIVEVQIQPRLQPEHSLRLLLDGQPYGQPGNVPTLQLVNLDRGEHSLAIQVLEGQTVLQQSPTIRLTVLRAHRGPTQRTSTLH